MLLEKLRKSNTSRPRRAHRKTIFGHEFPIHGGFRGDCDQLSACQPKESSRASAEGALNSHRVDGHRNRARCVRDLLQPTTGPKDTGASSGQRRSAVTMKSASRAAFGTAQQ